MFRVIGAAALGLCVTTTPAVPQSPCSDVDAAKAARLMDRAKDWPSLEHAFHAYPDCDDGALAEGYDDKVVVLLADHWKSVSDLRPLFKRDPRFEPFVLRHLDTLMSRTQAKQIATRASRKCPPKLSSFCERLKAKAQNPN